MKYLIAITVLFLTSVAIISCGSDEVNILVISKERMEAMCTEDYECYGYATWSESNGVKYCTIFMLPDEYYPTFADYEYVLDHEKKHCREGSFH